MRIKWKRLSPEEVTQVVWLRDVEGMSNKDIAKLFNACPGTICECYKKEKAKRKHTDYKDPTPAIMELARAVRHQQVQSIFKSSPLGFWV